MSRIVFTGTLLVCAGLGCGVAAAQTSNAGRAANSAPVYNSAPGPAPVTPISPVPLESTPPALMQLSTIAVMKTNFTLDRNMLDAAAAVLPGEDMDVRQTLRKLDGMSVRILRFGEEGMVDTAAIESIRAEYHLRGWKHLVTSTNSGGPVHNNTTDVWLVLDGVTVKGAVVLAETPKSLTLVTVAGNINPVDVLHLRGHFGIPRFDGDTMRDEHIR